ncbi:MAG: hypothetical protein H6622_05495 [Halobacteriovoraceae bacterium]|nr:hypothetical protein [Halobacteriovoraceae bacterium]
MNTTESDGIISHFKGLFNSPTQWSESYLLEKSWSNLSDDDFLKAIESPFLWTAETCYSFFVYAINRLYYKHMKTNIEAKEEFDKKEAIQHKRIYLFEMVSNLAKEMISRVEKTNFSPELGKRLIAEIEEMSFRFSKIRPGKSGKVEVYVIKGKLLSFDLEKKKFILRCKLLQDKLHVGIFRPHL